MKKTTLGRYVSTRSATSSRFFSLSEKVNGDWSHTCSHWKPVPCHPDIHGRKGAVMTTTDSEVNENSVPVQKGPAERSFPDPYTLETPEGAEGWEEMYAYHNRFLPTRRAEDSAKTWFRNSLHYPEVSYPFDQVTIDGAF